MLNPKVRIGYDPSCGSYYLDYKAPDGRRRRPRVGKDRGEAEEMAVAFRRYLRQGLDPEHEMERARKVERVRSTTLREFFPIFVERYGCDQSEGMQQNYRSYFANLCRCKALADCPIGQVTKSKVLEYMKIRIKQDGVKPGTAAHEGRFINGMLNRAVEWDILEQNPLAGIRFPKGSGKRDVNLSVEQAKTLLDDLPPIMADMAELAIYTGWRKSNIRLLRIEQISFHDLTGTGEVFLVTKGGYREVKPLSQASVELLKRVIGERGKGYVFLNPHTGHPYTRSGFNAFDKAVKRLGFTARDGSKLRFHDLRHACASFLKNIANASLDDIREILGHRNRSTTDRYTTYNRQVVGLLNQIPRLRE